MAVVAFMLITELWAVCFPESLNAAIQAMVPLSLIQILVQEVQTVTVQLVVSQTW